MTSLRADRRRAALRVENVDVNLGGRRVLEDVTFELESGSFSGLIGPNGAGKTTLIRVILGLIRPSRGRVLHSDAGERSIGYVPQKTFFDADVPLRARDFVALGTDGQRLGIPLPNARRRRAVDEMLDALDATALSDARIGELSGGEQQRVLIAHALISRPRLLLLDEPLANLDLKSGQEVIALLSRISKQRGVAILLSAHEMNPLLPVTDRIVYLAGGRVASGTTDEVVRPEVLSALYGHHVDVLHVHGRVLVIAGPGSGDEALLTEGHSLVVADTE